MKILVVDDIEQNRLMLFKLLSRKAHQILFAENGLEAIEQFNHEQPDLVLMDIMMPVMDGFEATAKIRALNIDKWVPILILSAVDGEDNVVKGLEAGADDYLPKPINPAILYAKLTSIERSIEMQNSIIEGKRQLQAYQDQNEVEQRFAQTIFDRLIHQNDLQDPQLNYWLLPARRFSGDLVCVKRISPDRLYFMLADSTGHGLAAALPTIIVNQVFQGMTKKRLLVSCIAREINNRLKKELPAGHFVALALGMVDNRNQWIEIWNGGLPDQWALDLQGIPIRAFKSQHTFAGVLDNDEFDDGTEIWQWQQACELFFYSDGLVDIEDPLSECSGHDWLLKTLKQSTSRERIQAIQAQLSDYMQKNEIHDDISCLSIQCR
ncbi:fused response regulator/phosphatase [Methylotuvimicrobium alcaliphilum]|uniref:Two-component response regulator n=1 Tax=Methylotuvimicrobium alcaliphilum (strain DSM 19304 / NCIMB 14124 / VKM B-2133 / 20Z) TaxID=1091494 RepID=G4SWF0_META2